MSSIYLKVNLDKEVFIGQCWAWQSHIPKTHSRDCPVISALNMQTKSTAEE